MRQPTVVRRVKDAVCRMRLANAWGARGLAIAACLYLSSAAQAGHDIVGLRHLMRQPAVSDEGLAFLKVGESLPAPQGTKQGDADGEPEVGDGSIGTGTPAASDAQLRQQAVQWLQSYANRQVLFAERDVQRLQEFLENRPIAAVSDWWSRTHFVRQQLDSPTWRQTAQWLHDFLAGQAVYSDVELDQFREWLANRDPDGLSDVLLHLHRTRLAKQKIRVDAERMRERFVADQTFRAASARYARPGRLGGRVPSVRNAPMEQVERRSSVVQRPNLSRRIATIYVNQAIFGNRWFFVP